MYAPSEDQLDDLVMLVRQYSQDTGMQFGLDKYAVLTLKRGFRVRCEGIGLSVAEVMKEVDESGYRYLGVLEGADIKKQGDEGD